MQESATIKDGARGRAAAGPSAPAIPDVVPAAGTSSPTPTGLYLTHLVVRALTGRPADEPPSGVAWQTVHDLAAFHSVESLSWFAVRSRPDLPPDLARAWASESDRTLWRRVQFDVEREQVLAALAQAGFSYVPLKGILVADLYPDPAMRSMSDNDILYAHIEPDPAGGWRVRGGSPEKRAEEAWRASEEVARVMEGLGYRAAHLHAGETDAFTKPPCFNFELHRALMPGRMDFGGYYDNPWSRAVPADGGDPHAFRFSPEDDYVYRTAHCYKHFSGGGCGIRHLADEQVFLASCGDGFDWGYAEGELAAIGILDFEHALRGLTLELFAGEGLSADGAGLSPEAARMLGYLLGSGVYGTADNHVRNAVADAGGSGARYAWRRFVPPLKTLREGYPVLVAHPAGYPFVVVWRWLKAIAHLPRTLHEIRVARKSTQ